jgi:hypothetical protein
MASRKIRRRGDGIHVIAWTRRAGRTHVQHVAGENPSLFTLRPDNRVLYSVHGD